ncbi:MAG: helix-turn-helix domain-containing protein [bacterium]|nr:helix-turn-helix domain-containing protein [bacterium]
MGETAPGDPADEAARTLARAVGAVVARLRRERGWSLEDLADEAGRHRTYMGLIERGERHLSVATAFRISQALGLSLSELIDLAAAQASGTVDPVRFPRRIPPPNAARGAEAVKASTGLTEKWVPSAVEATYETLDRIDEQLVNTGSEPLAKVVELANLSAIVGNLMRSALQGHSDGAYRSNAPHTYPDLVSESDRFQDLEIKIALEGNMPKGHLPKPGAHLICRYVLAERDATYSRGDRGHVVWIWEARLGELSRHDFNTSNTPGDSGKTAVVKADSLYRLTCVYYDERFLPLAKARSGH